VDVKELEHELDDLKVKVEQQHQIIMVLLNGGTVLNKHMETLEAFVVTVSQLSRMTQRELDRHLELLREASVPLPEPKAPKVPQQGIEVG
jgi:hypothetical protein